VIPLRSIGWNIDACSGASGIPAPGGGLCPYSSAPWRSY